MSVRNLRGQLKGRSEAQNPRQPEIGKIRTDPDPVLYVGEADTIYLNNGVYLADEFLRSTTNPPYGGVVDYEPRAEHCWSGDHTQPNAIARLRYHQFFAPKIVERILKTAPKDGDATSWRY
jgi:hypothetical protein